LKVISTNQHVLDKHIPLLKAQGVEGVIRYIGEFPSGKGTDKAEVARLRAAGFKVVFVYETGVDQTLGGKAHGLEDVAAARKALTALGEPLTTFLYFACDTDTSDTAHTNAYMDAVGSVHGKPNVGLYGSHLIIQSAYEGGHAAKVWMSQSLGWMESRVQYPNACLLQGFKDYGALGGLDYEANIAKGDYGYTAGVVAVPPPVVVAPPATPTGEALPTVTQTLNKARADVGIHEHNGDNQTSINVWFGMSHQPYCAMGVSKWLKTSGWNIDKNAGADELGDELMQKYHWKQVPAKDARAGDIIVFTWSHIGICESRRDASHINTIEANSGDGGVHKLVRSNSEIGHAIRPPYSVTPKPEAPVVIPVGKVLTRPAKVFRDCALWNETAGTKRADWIKGGIVTVLLGFTKVIRGNRYEKATSGGKTGWVRYDNIRWA
jgi:hypothetical protein